MKIYLIRHGKTAMNGVGHKKLFSGSTDVSVSQEGLERAAQWRQTPIWGKLSTVYITPLRRTAQTADVLFSSDIPRVVIPELAEMDFGEYEGKPTDTPSELDPLLKVWREDPERAVFPGGEAVIDHSRAALEALHRLVKEAAESGAEEVAVVSHAATIRMILALLLMGDIRYFRSIPCDNVGVNILTFEEETLQVKTINLLPAYE